MSAPLDPSLLLKAYAAGIFPMADGRDAAEVYWVEPKKRGILPLDDFRLSRSLTKTLKSGRFETTLDRAFGDVVAHCAAEAPDRPSTWINDQIETAVTQLHNVGSAHSIETWADGSLSVGFTGSGLAAPSLANRCSVGQPTHQRWRSRIWWRGCASAALRCLIVNL